MASNSAATLSAVASAMSDERSEPAPSDGSAGWYLASSASMSIPMPRSARRCSTDGPVNHISVIIISDDSITFWDFITAMINRDHGKIRHNYIGHNKIGNNYTGHNKVGHHYIGHKYIGHNYIRHNYIGIAYNHSKNVIVPNVYVENKFVAASDAKDIISYASMC